jgi:alpha-galactosidase
MSIKFNAEKKIFKLDTKESSYVFGITEQGVAVHYYYGATVGDDDLAYLAERWGLSGVQARPHYAPGSRFNMGTQPLEYSTFGTGDYRPTALRIKAPTGDSVTDLAYVSHEIFCGKPDVEGMPETHAGEDEAQTLVLTLKDSFTEVYVKLYYTVFENLSVMTRHAVVENRSDKAVDIESVYSLNLDLQGDYDFIHLWGRPCFERNFERTRLGHTVTTVQSLRGASSHFHNPFVALASPEATEDFGEVYGFNLVYSGNFAASAYKDPTDGVRFVMGINHDGFGWLLEPGARFTAPETVMVYSDKGLGHMSRTFHKLYSKHLCKSEWMNKKRPILINNWEGTYFKFDADKLCAIAEKAAGLGVELFVLDDGWFGARNHDRAGLGDWKVNEEKLGCTMGELARRINGFGMKFGLWFEPEMVNPDSDLYRAHPDWVVHVDGRPMSLGRNQLLLDFSRKEVRDYIFDSMVDVLDNANIEYVKWDYNRNFTEVGSSALPAERQREVLHRYMLGLYEFLDKFIERYPHILLEGCSSGGGRFDPAMLYYSPQFWTSDCSDAAERLFIQHGTSMCYPTATMGAHVSTVPNHQTKRVTPFSTRGNVALSGTFGYELDATKFTEEECEAVKAQCLEYHKLYDVIHYGELYRLITPYDGNCDAYAWEYVSEDKNEVLLTYVLLLSRPRVRRQVRFKGLDPEKTYENQETGAKYKGSTLMNAGLNFVNFEGDFNSLKIHLKAID